MNCLANMLTRENSHPVVPSLSMFTPGSSSYGPSIDKGKALVHLMYQPRNGLFLNPWDESLSEDERRQLLDFASRKEAEKYLEITLIKQIQATPLKLQILERWEISTFRSFENAQSKLKNFKELWIDCNEENDQPVWYVDIGEGNLTWSSYSLILQFGREERFIMICGDPGNLQNKSWSGWTEIFLDKFYPHVDWVNRRANFILHLQADMEVADQNHQWFKFLLRHQGGRYTRLEHTVYTEKKVY